MPLRTGRPGAAEGPNALAPTSDFTVVSFYAGDVYYRLAAMELRADCERLGIAHNIRELPVQPDEDWGMICRRKVQFYRDMMAECGTPILWVDVDCRINAFPDYLTGSRFDVVGYLRRFTYARSFHLSEVARFWTPSILYFNNNDRTKRFLDYMALLEASSSLRATDDYYLEEAWRSFPEELAIGLLPPVTLARNPDQVSDRTYFLFGASGNVDSFVDKVEQHRSLVNTPRFQQAALEVCIADAMAEGRPDEARIIAGRSYRLAPDNYKLAYRYAEMLRKAEDYDAAVGVLQQCASDPIERPEALRQIVNLRYNQKTISADAKRAFLIEMMGSEHPAVAAIAKARLCRLEMNERARRKGLKSRDRPHLWWMETPYPGNFGDVLNPYLIEKITGSPPVFQPKGRRMLAIGSVIRLADADTVVWGAGTPRLTDKLSAEAEYLAVRGPLTRELVLRSGGQCPDIYGDPALLLPYYLQPTTPPPRHKLGLIRHINHQDVPLKIDDDVLEISVSCCGEDGIEGFVDQLLDCEMVLSSSLHGLIVANAYGIPARWCTFSSSQRQLPGDGVKFADYFMSIGMPVQEVLDLSGFDRIDASLAKYIDHTVDLKFDAERLLGTFYEVLG